MTIIIPNNTRRYLEKDVGTWGLAVGTKSLYSRGTEFKVHNVPYTGTSSASGGFCINHLAAYYHRTQKCLFPLGEKFAAPNLRIVHGTAAYLCITTRPVSFLRPGEGETTQLEAVWDWG